MSKPPTVFLAEMTNAEVERFLSDHHTVIVPVGSTEQHGPHLRFQLEIAQRVHQLAHLIRSQARARPPPVRGWGIGCSAMCLSVALIGLRIEARGFRCQRSLAIALCLGQSISWRVIGLAPLYS